MTPVPLWADLLILAGILFVAAPFVLWAWVLFVPSNRKIVRDWKAACKRRDAAWAEYTRLQDEADKRRRAAEEGQ